MLTSTNPTRALAYCRTTHSTRLGDQIPIRSPGLRPTASNPWPAHRPGGPAHGSSSGCFVPEKPEPRDCKACYGLSQQCRDGFVPQCRLLLADHMRLPVAWSQVGNIGTRTVPGALKRGDRFAQIFNHKCGRRFARQPCPAAISGQDFIGLASSVLAQRREQHGKWLIRGNVLPPASRRWVALRLDRKADSSPDCRSN